jgi:hypothetical protein
MWMKLQQLITHNDYQSIYMVQKWKRILILLYVKTISQSTIPYNILFLVLNYMINFSGLRLEELGKKR